MSFETYYRASPATRAAIDALVKLSPQNAELAFEASNNLRQGKPSMGRKRQLEEALEEAFARTSVADKEGRKCVQKKELRAIARSAWGPDMTDSSLQSTLSNMKAELVMAGKYDEDEVYLIQNV
jgi:hypothetical protein